MHIIVPLFVPCGLVVQAIPPHHADNDLNEQETRFIKESYTINPPTKTPDQPSPEERYININNLVNKRLGDKEIKRS
jgi:hypothetical protein